MPVNTEIKAKVHDMNALRALARDLATCPMEIILQKDVFFKVPHGRLKLRIFSDKSAELIQYERPDTAESKQSHYQIYPISNPQEFRLLMAKSLGETVVVKKRRELYLVGQTRIHLDEVEGLGNFMELEVVLTKDQDATYGQRIAQDFMEKLSINEEDLESCAYADLLITMFES